MTRAAAFLLLVAGLGYVSATSQPEYHHPPAATAVVPYYGATYTPPGGFTRDQAGRVVELLEAIDGRLKRLEERGGPAASAAPKLDVLAVAATRCVQCHTPARADGRGGGFILLADETGSALKPLSGREKARVKEAVLSGTMPPSRPLSPAEKAAFE